MLSVRETSPDDGGDVKGRVLVRILMLACLCGGLVLYYIVYREVQMDLSLFTTMADSR